MSTIKNKVPASVDEYISTFPTEIQETLELVRATVRKAAPTAVETIKYAMPTYTMEGNLVYFAAFKKHLGFYPVPNDNKTLKNEMEPYKQGKGSIQFPLDQPMPLALITQLVEWNIERLAREK